MVNIQKCNYICIVNRHIKNKYKRTIMKRNVFYALMIVFSMTLHQSVSAQNFTWVGDTRDASGNIIRGSFLTNEWYDNWHFGISGGAITNFSKISSPRVTPTFEVSTVKWFTPSVGIRLGYQGQWGKEYLKEPYNPYLINHSRLPFDNEIGNPGTLSYGMYYVHGDFLLNVHNTFFGYDANRIWNASPYVNAGYLSMYDNKGGSGCDHEVGFGVGIFNTFHITERLLLTADIKQVGIASRYKTEEGIRTNFVSFTVGLAYNIRRCTFRRANTILAENVDNKAAIVAANEIIEQKQEEVKVLEQQVAEQKQIIDESEKIIEMNAQDLKLRAASANQVLFFAIGKSTLANTEKQHLRNYVQSQLEAQPDHVFYLTGSADKGTGTMEFNTTLSQKRAREVRDILAEEYGVKPENIVIKATVVADKDPEGELDRCVLIESGKAYEENIVKGHEENSNDYAYNK